MWLAIPGPSVLVSGSPWVFLTPTLQIVSPVSCLVVHKGYCIWDPLRPCTRRGPRAHYYFLLTTKKLSLSVFLTLFSSPKNNPVNVDVGYFWTPNSMQYTEMLTREIQIYMQEPIYPPGSKSTPKLLNRVNWTVISLFKLSWIGIFLLKTKSMSLPKPVVGYSPYSFNFFSRVCTIWAKNC